LRELIWLSTSSAVTSQFLVPFSLLICAGEWVQSLIPARVVARPAVVNAMEQITLPFPRTQVFDATGSPTAGHHANWLLVVLVAVWVCGALVVAIRFGCGYWSVYAAKRGARPQELAADVPVLTSLAKIEPRIVGIFRPVLLMADEILERLTPEQLRMIVAHEMCHVRRRDNLTFAVHMIWKHCSGSIRQHGGLEQN
jgi:beta-lactamase regulating signal transducer with metallopeptidase domain